MSKTRRKQHEAEFLRKLRAMFTSADKVEAFEDCTLYEIEFADGQLQQVTLHFDEE